MTITVSELVAREVFYCVSVLVSEMLKLEDAPDRDDLTALCIREPDGDDWREALAADGEMVVGTEVGNCRYWYGLPKKDYDEIRVYQAHFRESAVGLEPTHGGYVFCNISETDDPDCLGDNDAVTGRLYESEAEALDAALSEAGTYLSADEEDEAAEEYGRICNVEPETCEVLEHWIVSNWLAERLSEKGESVGEWCGLTIWGRCTSGQAICADGIIERIHADLTERHSNEN